MSRQAKKETWVDMNDDRHDQNLTLSTIKAIMDERDIRYTQLAAASEKAISAALAAAEKAVSVQETNSLKWRESANVWRDAMNDRETQFVKTDNFRTTIENITKDIKELKSRIDLHDGKGVGLNQLWIIIVAAISTLGILVMLYTHWIK
jgi:hypothetical protein